MCPLSLTICLKNQQHTSARLPDGARGAEPAPPRARASGFDTFSCRNTRIRITRIHRLESIQAHGGGVSPATDESILASGRARRCARNRQQASAMLAVRTPEPEQAPSPAAAIIRAARGRYLIAPQLRANFLWRSR